MSEPICSTSSITQLTCSLQGNNAIDQIFRVINEQSQGTFDDDYNVLSYYNWTGGNGALSPAVTNEGNGEPKAYTGLVGTHHRPSDDISVFGMKQPSTRQRHNWLKNYTAFLTPANAMLSVELKNLADILDAAGKSKNVSESARSWSSKIHGAIMNTTVCSSVVE